LTLDGGLATEEIVKVQAISGSGPYTCTVTPALAFAHPDEAAVEYEPGVSTSLLGSTTATIDSATEQARILVQGGAHGQLYRVSMLVTTATPTQVLEDDFILRVVDR
jgi:hypothetical protein